MMASCSFLELGKPHEVRSSLPLAQRVTRGVYCTTPSPELTPATLCRGYPDFPSLRTAAGAIEARPRWEGSLQSRRTILGAQSHQTSLFSGEPNPSAELGIARQCHMPHGQYWSRDH